ncbi:unnamed protein product [Musa acuminata subsp. malaccensis]|uniref:(wild Malaysian banana) hypothetical protein n=1 Tax=Musa acuminata subsp. malaccensis TaxID=214687 RepID=A0A804IXA1_MUSAM|nr:unnamed protein product [Musa acuminata subsp. malaccensis]
MSVAAVEGKEEEINCVWKDNKLGLFTATTASSDRRNFFSEPASASCCRVVNNSKNLSWIRSSIGAGELNKPQNWRNPSIRLPRNLGQRRFLLLLCRCRKDSADHEIPTA